MELQHSEPMTKYSSYDLPSGRLGGAVSGVKSQYVKTVLFVIVVLLLAVGLFIGGYYSGSKTVVVVEGGGINVKEVNVTEDPDIEWSGVCPKKTLSCPESYQGIPPLILISLDGFRPDYLKRGYTPTLNNIVQCGTHAPYMYPVFPSKTFPNHFSIVTGLFPESHGIIDNNMYDPDTGKMFKVGNSEFLKSYWWEAEPIWVTAQNQSKRSSCFYWPGSEAEIKGVRPNDYKKYSSNFPFDKRVDIVLEWLDRPKETRPDFITLYVHQPDRAGHYFGITSSQVNDELVKVDKMIAKLFSGLQQRDLLNCVNVIILSDHGLTDVSCNRLLKLQNYVNLSEVYSTLGVYGRLRPKGQKNETVEEEMISNLQCKNEHMRVYEKRQLPVRYHYSKHKRIESIFLDLDNGWSLTNQQFPKNCNGGAHGYDNFFESMRTLFMAHGPSFKQNYTVEPFLNIEVYELMAELLNITANPNNGTKGSLHDLLLEHEELPVPVEPIPPTIGTMPSSKKEVELRVYAANCTCGNKNATLDQVDLTNLTEIHNLHLPFGIPTTLELNHSHVLLYNNDYVSTFDPKYRLPMWSSFTLSEKITIADIKPCWRGDARISFKDTPACEDYNVPMVSSQGILQRPLFPLSFATDENVHEASFVTNSVPKHENHIAIVERSLEWMISSWLQLKSSINIITGPAFDLLGTGVFPGIEFIMQTHVQYGPLVMPTHYFYIITWCTEEGVAIQNCSSTDISVAAFLLPNTLIAYNCESPEELIKKHTARVADVENLTGMSFFTKLPIYEAIRLRTSVPEI